MQDCVPPTHRSIAKRVTPRGQHLNRVPTVCQTLLCLHQSRLWLQAASGGDLCLGAWEFHPLPVLHFEGKGSQLQWLSREKHQTVIPPPPAPDCEAGGRINTGSGHSLKGSPEHLCSSLLSWECWGSCSEGTYKRNAHCLWCSERQLHSRKREPRRS